MAEKSTRVKSTMGGKSKPKKRRSKKSKIHHMKIQHAANGGYLATHHAAEEEAPEESAMPHAIQDLQGLHDHIDENMSQPPQPMPAQQVAGV